jgi:hypothetical protein
VIPEEIVPEARTEISLVDGTEMVLVMGAGAWFIAEIPEPAEFMVMPAAVTTSMFPVPLSLTLMPVSYPFTLTTVVPVTADAPRVVIVPPSSLTVTLPIP